MKRAKDVEEYIAKAPKELQDKLKQLRATIKSVAPSAAESISYGMPYYSYKGRLAYFAYAKHHIGLYAMPLVVKGFKKELKKYQTAKATIRFPLEEELPLGLIKKLVKAAVIRNEELKMDNKKGKLTICSRGHKFYKNADVPVCPICWPGRYKKKSTR